MNFLCSTFHIINGGGIVLKSSTFTTKPKTSHIKSLKIGLTKRPPKLYRKYNTNSINLKTRALVEVNDNNFEDEVLKSDLPVLVDFCADWCGPCKLLDTIIKQIDQDYNKSLKVVKMDIDPSPNTTEKYKIYGLPTIMIFQNGNSIEDSKREGAISQKDLEQYLSDFGILKI